MKKIIENEKLRLVCYIVMLLVLLLAFSFVSDTVMSWFVKSSITIIIVTLGITKLESIINSKD